MMKNIKRMRKLSERVQPSHYLPYLFSDHSRCRYMPMQKTAQTHPDQPRQRIRRTRELQVQRMVLVQRIPSDPRIRNFSRWSRYSIGFRKREHSNHFGKRKFSVTCRKRSTASSSGSDSTAAVSGDSYGNGMTDPPLTSEEAQLRQVKHQAVRELP